VADADLTRVLETARSQRLLGPGPVAFHVEHARAHLRVAALAAGESWADLGSGAGLPGLVFGTMCEEVELFLVERAAGRCEFLRWAVGELGLGDRVEVVESDAVEAARNVRFRGRMDGVAARAFGAPAVVAECAVGLLKLGGRLVVSEPPEGSAERWPESGLAELGLGPVQLVGSDPSFARMVQERIVGDAVPRRWARIKREPMFE
jgi:16S rRNA (guanine527-N7)-methyltransferase